FVRDRRIVEELEIRAARLQRLPARALEQVQEVVALALVERRQLGPAAALVQEIRQRVLHRRERRERHELVGLAELGGERRRRGDVAHLPARHRIRLAERSDDETAVAQRGVARPALVLRAIAEYVLRDLV